MKNKFLILLILLLICITGCKDKSNTKNKLNGVNDKTFSFRLMSNESSGSRWYYNISDDKIIELKEEYDYSNCSKDSDGCTGSVIYTVKALKPGNVTLSMKFCSFVYENSCDYDVFYDFTIDDNLNIKESHYGSYFNY